MILHTSMYTPRLRNCNNRFIRAEAERRKREAMAATNKMLADEISTSEKKLKRTEDDLMEFRYVYNILIIRKLFTLNADIKWKLRPVRFFKLSSHL